MDSPSDNQMGQPSTPTDTTATRDSPDEQDSVPSPDPPSTRPNPFVDGDLLARKRRRTSGSTSPPPSTSTQDEAPLISNIIDTNSIVSNDSVLDQLRDAKVMPALKNPELLHTPQITTGTIPSSSTPLSSSKVTLNLRNSNDTSLNAMEPPSPTPKQPTCSTINAEGTPSDTKKNVRRVRSNISESTKSNSASPPVELISISDAETDDSDDEMVFSVDDRTTGIIGHDLPTFDPVLRFPFSEPDDDPSAPLHRLLEYFSTHSPIDSKVIVQVQAWIEDYLNFAESSEQIIVLNSRETYKAFWLTFPSVISQLSVRGPETTKALELRNSIFDIFSTFTCLAARMVALDVASIKDTQSACRSDSQSFPNIFAPRYLQQLYEILFADTGFVNAGDEAQSALSWPPPEIASYLVIKFQANQGRSVNDLSQLAHQLISLVPQSPRLMDALAPVAQILGACMREAAFTVNDDHGGSRIRQAKVQLQYGHKVWSDLTSCLELVIEKHVTQLSADTATALLHASSEILKCVLRGGHPQAADTLHKHELDFPGLSIRHTIEAIVWKWRVDILERLIRSSQMQLRVMAISKLCSDLVFIWKSAANAADEDNTQFLDHLGNHMLQTHLADYIFGPNCHPEIIVESANILGFLIVTKTYNQSHTDRLWQGLTQSQDPRVADALARVISNITNLLDYDGLLIWCEKLYTLPLEDYSPAIRTLWDSVMEAMVSRCQTEHLTPSLHPYNLCLRLLRDASAVWIAGRRSVDPELQFAATQKLKELLIYGPKPEDRKILYSDCIDDIAQQSFTTLGSLWCLSMAIRGTVSRDLQVLTDQHDFPRLVVEELAHVIRASKQLVAVAVLSGDHNIPRRDMIANIVHFQSSAITEELGTKLFNLLVGPESPCAEDRAAGWLIIINVLRKASLKNVFIQTCFSKYLPGLSASCFSDGMLDFIRERVLSLARDNNDFTLDDPETLSNSGVELLWRIVLEADDPLLVSRAISTLAIDLYLESNAMRLNSKPRARKIHALLVSRCLNQMRSAARKIKGSSRSIESRDDEAMIIVAADRERLQQETVFRRSLQLLRYFLEKYQAEPKFPVPDLRPFISGVPEDIVGSSAELKYQAFDGCKQTCVKPLRIGRGNTVACLLSCIREASGFEDFRIYYRGQQWFPSEDQITLTLYDLHIKDNIILVKREEDSSRTIDGIRPGSSQLEIEILAHFEELWDYLGMDEAFAEDMYEFLVQLPADGNFIARFESENVSHVEIFLKGQPFKMLYAIHAIGDYVEAAKYPRTQAGRGAQTLSIEKGSFQQAVDRSLCLVVDAISDSELLDDVSSVLRLRIVGALMQIYVKLFNDASNRASKIDLNSSMLPSAIRLYDILCMAENSDDESSLILIERACTAIFRVGSSSAEFCHTITSETRFLKSIADYVLKDTRKWVRQTVVELIVDTVRALPISSPAAKSDDSAIRSQGPHQMITSLCSVMIDVLPCCLDYSTGPEEYFRLLLYLVEQINTRSPSAVHIESLAITALDLLLKHNSTEEIDQPDAIDPIVTGLTSVLHTCLQLDEKLSNSAAIHDSVATRLFWRHLFPRKHRGDRGMVCPVVLNTPTRMKLHESIFLFIMYKRTTFYHMLDAMKGLVPFYNDEPDDPYMYDIPYHFDRSRAIRASCGYVGLRNLSNTCYLNSLFTQLFMNIQFRNFILSVEVKDQGDSQQLLFRTQKLFGYMQESYQRFVDPSAVVTSIKTYDDTMIDIHSQMDVDEFYNLLFDRWEGQLLGNEQKKQLRSFFGGQLVQQVKSKECEHISERLEPFSAIQCDIKGKTTLQESLQAYVDGEIMEGENKYKCSTCDRHVDAVKRACLKDVPDNLICHLKRFDFNLRTMQRSKINDYFSFPLMLDIAPYTVDYLSAKGDAPQKDMFELVGILVHSGTAESGHYYSYIRERGPPQPPVWVEFNDDLVNPWDPSLMESSTFGGPDQQAVHDTSNGILFDRTYSAYMLFYQRATSLRAGLIAHEATNKRQSFSPKIPPPMKEHISNENRILIRRHCLFDPSYTLFVQRCFGHAIYLGEDHATSSPPASNAELDTKMDESSHRLQNLAMELALSHFDQVVTRAKELPFLGPFSSLLHNAITKCYDCAFAFYNYFNMRPPALRALVQRNPDTESRRFAGMALIQAVENIRTGLPRLYYHSRQNTTPFSRENEGGEEDWEESDFPTSVLQGTMDIFNHLWRFFHIHIRAWDEYFAMMLAFAKLGDLEVGYLLGENYLLRLLRIINADAAIEQPTNYQRMIANLMRRFVTKPASYSSILSLIDYLMAQLEPLLSPEVIVEEATERRGMRKPFPWTSDEIEAIHNHPERQATSFFVEKLLDLDQAPKPTIQILGRMIQSGEELDLRVFNTLRKQIQGDTSMKPMDSSIRAASQYVERSEFTERAQLLTRHICLQARSLQHSEGATFLGFIESVLKAQEPDEDTSQERRQFVIQLIPTWAPYLLVYNDERTRNNAETVISEVLFQPLSRTAIDQNEDGDKNDTDNEQRFLPVLIRQVGIKCLLYLQEYHVKRGIQLERNAASNILRVISKCTPFYEPMDGMNEFYTESAEFAAIEAEIRTPLQRLLVDELDDDGSDWDGSCGSSELMDANPGISM